jgi:hypothetical protein
MKIQEVKTQPNSLRAAKLEARARRAAGEQVKIMKESRIYTQPGVGISNYTIFYVLPV